MSVSTLNNHIITVNDNITTLSPNSDDLNDRLIVDGITINEATLEENTEGSYSLQGYTLSHNIYTDELTLSKDGNNIILQDWENGDYGIHLITNEITFRFETTIDTTAIGGDPFTPFILTYTFDPDLAINTGNTINISKEASYGPTRGSLQVGEYITYFSPTDPFRTNTNTNATVTINLHRESIAVENDKGTFTVFDNYRVIFQNQGEINGMPVTEARFNLIDLDTDMLDSLELPTDPSFAQQADYRSVFLQLRNENGQLINILSTENINTVDKRPFSITKVDTPQPDAGLDLTGSEGDDLLIGANSADVLYGVGGNDTIEAGAGDDTIIGGSGAGNDSYDGGEGIDIVTYTSTTQGIVVDLSTGTASGIEIDTDTLLNIENVQGGSGDDSLTGNAEANLLQGEAGNDSLNGLDGDDTLEGGEGNDTLSGGNGINILRGGAGSDVFVAEVGNTASIQILEDFDLLEDKIDLRAYEQITGMEQLNITEANGTTTIVLDEQTSLQINITASLLTADQFIFVVTEPEVPEIIEGTNKGDELIGTDGNDTIYGGRGRDTIYGNEGHDLITGENGTDYIDADTGDDTVFGGNAKDTIIGGEGNDLLYGENGKDSIDGQNGDDTLYGGNSNDTLNGGEGNDNIFGGKGADNITSGAGDDIIAGEHGNDTITGDDGDDSITGDDGRDLLEGNLGNDIIYGGNGKDSLYGGEGTDTLIGDSGHDMLAGGEGDDLLTGGQGRDTFFYASGADTITDFELGKDSLIFTFNNKEYDITSRKDLTKFVAYIEKDTDGNTDAVIRGNDLYLDFGDNVNYVLLEDIVGNGVTQAQLDVAYVDYWNDAIGLVG